MDEFLDNTKLTKGQKTAKKILEAAGRCISKVGVEKTSITAIAREAELKRSLIAYHFPKKEQIFYQVMLHIVAEFSQAFRTVNLPFGEDGLTYVLTTYMDYFQERPHYFHCFLHCFYLASINETYMELNSEITKKGIHRIEVKALEVLVEKNIHPQLDIARAFSEDLYTKLIGTIVLFTTVKQEKNYETFKKQWITLLSHEIKLFVSFCKRHGTFQRTLKGDFHPALNAMGSWQENGSSRIDEGSAEADGLEQPVL